MLFVLLPGSVALQVWAWRSLRKRVMAGANTKTGAVLRYGGWALVPLALFLGIYLGAVGFEELSGAAIIPESLGRTALPVAALLLGVRVRVRTVVAFVTAAVAALALVTVVDLQRASGHRRHLARLVEQIQAEGFSAFTIMPLPMYMPTWLIGL